MTKFKNIVLIVSLVSYILIEFTQFIWIDISWNMLIMLFQYALIPVIGILFFLQLGYWIDSKCKLNWNFYSMILIILILLPVFYYPTWAYNLINGKDLFIAHREGGGNCQLSLKLKENNKCALQSSCWGYQEDKGKYKVSNDTIKLFMKKDTLYAVQHPDSAFVLYNYQQNTYGMIMSIYKNELAYPE